MITLSTKRGTGGPDPNLKNHKNIGFLRNTGPDPLKKHGAFKPEFNLGPTSARQRNAIFADSPMMTCL